MSMDTCKYCGRAVNSDADPGCYWDLERQVWDESMEMYVTETAWQGCKCESCRESEDWSMV